MSLTKYIKDPHATLDFGFNWRDATSPWLGSAEIIFTHTITADTGITVESSTEDGGLVTVWLSGGTAGEWYSVACKITTSDGRTDERTIQILVENR
jgi:hypothetical protein